MTSPDKPKTRLQELQMRAATRPVVNYVVFVSLHPAEETQGKLGERSFFVDEPFGSGKWFVAVPRDADPNATVASFNQIRDGAFDGVLAQLARVHGWGELKPKAPDTVLEKAESAFQRWFCAAGTEADILGNVATRADLLNQIIAAVRPQ